MKSFYVTTPIYYVNDLPHIGHAYTTLACDILSRYHKLKNEKVYFLTGTDEHGQKVEKASFKSSSDPQSFTDKMSNNFKKLTTFLNCNTNDFIRTTETRHKKAAQYLWNKLLNNNQIYLDNYEGWYSIRDESFYVESELIKKNNKFFAPTGAEVDWVKEESYFFKLSQWQDKLIDYYTTNTSAIAPKTRYNEVLSFIKGGLKDLSISRTSFKWGIQVPNNEKHVMYVWIDALTNYLTGIGYPNEKDILFTTFWPGVHVVGKDILRFHAVYWPAFLMAANLPPPKRIFAHGWWTNEGEKISKSLGNTIDPFEIVNIYGIDQIRYFLFREVPFGNDGDFSRNSIANRINSDLSNNLGNLVQRVCFFVFKNCNSINKNHFDNIKDDNELFNFSLLKFEKYKSFFDNQEIDKAIKEVFELLSETNIYVDKQAPWSLKNKDIDRMNTVLSVSIEMIKRAAILLIPIIPKSSKKILDILNININDISFEDYDKIPSTSYKINTPTHIFPRINND